MPIIFMEGDMWSHRGLFLSLLCWWNYSVGDYSAWPMTVQHDRVHAETKTKLFSEPALESLSHTLSAVPHSACEVSAKCNFPVCTNAPIGCVPSPGSFGPRVAVEVTMLGCATCWRVSWSSKLEGVCRGPPQQGPAFLQCRWSRYDVNSRDFLFIGTAPAFFMDACKVPEGLLSFCSQQSACLASNRSDPLGATSVCCRQLGRCNRHW